MLTREENERLCRVGPGTPMGRLMRRYWIPVMPAGDLCKPDGPPQRVRLLGEDLVAIRDSSGKPGLFDPRCPHRGADLFFGRNEEDGLRCVYHGWKFDVTGRCVDMPSEPPDSNFKSKVQVTAYPCEEHGGVVWAYMGPVAQKPAFPMLDWDGVPDTHRVVARRLQQSNWLQGYEGGWDTAHLPFLHRGDTEKDNRFFQRKGADAARDLPTQYDMAPTDFGFVYGSGRPAQGQENEGGTVWAVSMMFMPCWKVFRQFSGDGRYTLLGWVPIDDENTLLWSVEFHPGRALKPDELEHSGSFEYVRTELVPGTLKPVRNRDNDYLVDRELQARGSFTGIKGLALQDSSIQESMGPIADRTRERLMSTDRPIVLLRRELLRILGDLESGAPLPGLDPSSYRVRPAVFTAPRGATMAQAMDAAIAIAPAAMAK